MNTRHALLTSILIGLTLGLFACDRRDAGAELHALFDAEWERMLQESPETASYFGDPRFNAQWSDYTVEALEDSHRKDRAVLERLDRINRKALSDADRLNYDLFRNQYEHAIEGYRFRQFLIPVSPINWSGFSFANTLARVQTFATVKDYEDWITRLETYGRVVDQHITLMRQGMEEDRVPPRIAMERLSRQIEAQIVTDPAKSPLYLPLTRLPADLAGDVRKTLEDRAQAAIREVVVPAYRRFAEFFEQDYLPACRDSIAASELPDGPEFYAFRVRLMTTTDLSPEAIHQTGLDEVRRIREEMEAIRTQVGFRGDLQAFFTHLRTDPKFFFKRPEDLLDAYRVIAKRIDPEVVRLFGRMPRMPYGVIAVPDAQAPDATTAYYQRPAEDGSRAGFFFANLYRLETRPKWEMEALTLHEAVPGHHFQIALAQELGELPKFRRLGGYTAFIEGWGLYAESLGEELGLYQDPYSKFGQLTYEMWRAIRLVVDTGIHAKGWTRQQAIDFFKANAARTENDIAVEVDRYISWPGQALAYKIGELKIKELRARARQQLGERFDVRAFHDVVLGSGAVPLDVLERIVDEWIAAQTA
jgi:uncharacterized protein (DUF885 family)